MCSLLHAVPRSQQVPSRGRVDPSRPPAASIERFAAWRRRAGRSRRAQVDYAALLGEAAWQRLPATVRGRFAVDRVGEVTYVGRMETVAATTPGRALAALGRLVGEPLATRVGNEVPAHVRVYHEPGGGTVWERAYHFPGHPTRLVRSAKRLDEDGALLECLGAGLHMRLAVAESDGVLEFRSTGYFWRLLGVRIPLPRRWLPGETVVTHRDDGGGRFRFTLTIHHPLFGRIVHQDGAFREQEVEP